MSAEFTKIMNDLDRLRARLSKSNINKEAEQLYIRNDIEILKLKVQIIIHMDRRRQ